MEKISTEKEQPVKKTSKLKGAVVSVAMMKTLVVKVETLKTHSKYLKKYSSTKRYKVHNPEEKKYEEGDVVWFQACRPISKQKRHQIVEV